MSFSSLFNIPSFSFGFTILVISAFSLIFFWHILLKLTGWERGKASEEHFPPGPKPISVLGNCAQIDLRNPHRTFIKWKRQFGPIYTIHFPKRQVVICGAAEMNELLMQPKYADIFADRPTFSFIYGIFSNHQPDGNGIILSRGQIWQKNRRLALSAFRNLGMGRPQMEARIRHHKDHLIERLAALATQGTGIVDDFQPQLAFCYGNVIQDLVMGRHYEQYNDPKFLFFKKFIESTTKEIASLQMLLVDCWPWLRWLFPAYWRYIREGFALQRFLMREVDARIAHLRRHNGVDGPSLLLGEPECFVDAYLDAALAEGHRIDDPELKLTVVICAGDLWAGGLETVVTTTWWAALYMLHYPHVQTRLQAELDAQCAGRAFMLADRKAMPYFHAVIDELQRVANVLPWNVPHSTSQQVQFHGWTLPKDTIVQVQLGAVHLDPTNFPEPDKFRPERFLDENGKYKQSEVLKPFGLGKRSCMGESLVKMELPIVLASLLQNFNIKLIPGEPLPSLRRNPGIVSTPDPFKFIIQKRHDELILN